MEVASAGGFTMNELIAKGLQVPRASVGRRLEMAIARTLGALGWEHLPLTWRGDDRVRPYVPR
jgi:hypothetical protein